MSQKIAPGKWDGATRQLSKLVGYVFGLLMLVMGMRWGNTVFASGDPSMWSMIAVVVVLLLAGAALLPGIIVPIVYRVIDKVGKDTDGDE